MTVRVLTSPTASDRPIDNGPELRATASRSAVIRLRLSEFRCYERAALDCDARPVVLTGPNGAGKTNILEAISFLAPGRGLRGTALADMDRRGGAAPWAVAATLQATDGPVDIGTGNDPATGRRTVRVDGATVQGPAVLSTYASIVWLTPQMDRLFLDGAGIRRRFLDRLVFAFDPTHAARVSAYEHAMRERARLLKAGRYDPAWLGALEEAMAGRGVAIAAARRDVVDRLNRVADSARDPFPSVRLSVCGTVEGWIAECPALAAEERLAASLREDRPLDAQTGRTSSGPHRSDLEAEHAGTGMRAAFCSTGEQKALLLAIVLAHARLIADERGAAPILLLDEVAAHLDEARRDALIHTVLGLGTQAWLTGTDAALFGPLGGQAQFVRVENAAIFPRPHRDGGHS